MAALVYLYSVGKRIKYDDKPLLSGRFRQLTKRHLPCRIAKIGVRLHVWVLVIVDDL